MGCGASSSAPPDERSRAAALDARAARDCRPVAAGSDPGRQLPETSIPSGAPESDPEAPQLEPAAESAPELPPEGSSSTQPPETLAHALRAGKISRQEIAVAEDGAALRIQAHVRGREQRQRRGEQQAAVLRIQTAQRGRRARRAKSEMESELEERRAAALKMQAAQRGRAIRAEIQHQRDAALKVQAVQRGNECRARVKAEQKRLQDIEDEKSTARKRAEETKRLASLASSAQPSGAAADSSSNCTTAQDDAAVHGAALSQTPAGADTPRTPSSQSTCMDAELTPAVAADLVEHALADAESSAPHRARIDTAGIDGADGAESQTARSVEGPEDELRQLQDLGPLPPPPPPSGYAPRDNVIAGLLAQVMCPSSGVLCVRGQGGLGKTTCTAAMIRDHLGDLKQRFGDGIFWMTVGEQPQSITGMQARLLRCLHAPPAAGGDAPKAVERVVGDEQEGAMRLASRLEERAVLLVLDDVWVDEHAKLFAVLPQVGRGGSLVVLTTRTPALLGATVAGKGVSEQRATDATVLAREYVLGTFSDSDGEALLSAAPSARTWDPLTKQVSTALLEVLDRLPLAVSIVAGAVGGSGDGAPTSWSDVLAAMTDQGESIGVDKTLAPVAKAMAFSLEQALPVDRAVYLQLGMFPEDVWVPVAVLEKYFGSTVANVAAAIFRLASRRLLQCTGSGEKCLVRLHDLCRERVRQLAADAGTAEHEQHERLVAAYRKLLSVPGNWWEAVSGPASADASYFCTWLGWHLSQAEVESGDGESKAAQLLENFAWLDLKLRSTHDVAGLLNDFRRWPSECNASIGTALVACAHIVETEHSQLAFQLVGRLPPAPVLDTAHPTSRSCARDAAAALLSGTITLANGAGKISFVPSPRTGTLRSVDGPLRSTMTAHTDWVRAVAISPDSEFLLSGSNDMSVKLWALATGRLLHNFVGHRHLVRGVAFAATEDMKYNLAASVAEDCRLLVWDLVSKKIIREIVLGPGRPACRIVCGIPVAIDAADGTKPDKLSLSVCTYGPVPGHVAVAFGPQVQIWDLMNGRKITETSVGSHSAQLDCVAVGGGMIAAGCTEGRLRLWRSKENSTICIHEADGGDGEEIRAISVNESGTRVLTGGDDAKGRVWFIEKNHTMDDTLPPPCELMGHDDWIYCVAMTGDGQSAATGSGDGTMRLWKLPKDRTGAAACIAVLNTQAGCFGCALSSDGGMAITASLEIRRWDVSKAVAEYTQAESSGGHAGPVVAVDICSDGNSALSIGKDGLVKVWSLVGNNAGQMQESKPAFRGSPLDEDHELPRCIGLSHDGSLVAIGTDEGAVLLYEYKPLRKGMKNRKLWPIFSGSADAKPFVPFDDVVVDLSFGCAGEHDCVAVSEDGVLLVIDCDGPSVDVRLKLDTTPKCLAVRGATAIVGSWDQPANLVAVDLEEGSVTKLDIEQAVAADELTRPKGRVQAVDLTADCSTAIFSTSDEPGNPQLWLYRLLPAPGQFVRCIYGLSDWVSRGVPVVISQDGLLALTCTWDRRLHVWDLSNPSAAAPRHMEPASLLRVDCSPVCMRIRQPWSATAGLSGSEAVLALGDDDGGVHFMRFVGTSLAGNS